jgi:hypothetical protein
VNTKVSHTQFSTLGAAPILVELPGFKNLGAKQGVDALEIAGVRIHAANHVRQGRVLIGADRDAHDNHDSADLIHDPVQRGGQGARRRERLLQRAHRRVVDEGAGGGVAAVASRRIRSR